MLQSLLNLCRAGGVGAVVHHFTFGLKYLSAALRADWLPALIFRQLFQNAKLLFLSTAFAFHRADDLRYHVTGALDYHRIANPDIFASDVIFVMESRLLDSNASNRDRFQNRVRIKGTGSADADTDVS